MALRGTGYAKRPAGTAATQAGASARDQSDAEEMLRPLPLDLRPLVSPYRRQGKISLRVERLPHRTRLSRGQNNGDRSWSLSLDDLEDLEFLAPQDLRGEHVLSIRVVSLSGGDAATVAVIEHTVASSDAPAASRKGSAKGNLALIDTAATERLQAEIDRLNGARDAALAELRQTLNREWEARARDLVDSGLKAARAEWESELKEKLAETAKRRTADIEQLRQTLKSEHEARSAKAEAAASARLEKERQRWQKEADAALAAAEKSWKAGEAARIAEAEEKRRALTSQLEAKDRSQKEFNALLAKAEKSWKEGEAARLAQVDSQWQARIAKSLAEALDRAAQEAEALRSKSEADWRERETTRLAAEKAEWQQQIDKVLEEARAAARRDADDALQAARTAWNADEAERAALAEAKWRDETARLVADARAQAAESGKAGEAGQAARLRDELAAANASLKDRDAELGAARQALEAIQLRLQGESAAKSDAAGRDKKLRGELESALTALKTRDVELSELRAASDAEARRLRDESVAVLDRAKTEWTTGEATRTSAAEKAWRDETARLVAEARAEALATGKAGEAGLIATLRDELTAVNKSLSDREFELSQLRRLAAEAAERLPQQLTIAISDAQKIWSREEAARLSEAEARWRAATDQALAEVRKSLTDTPDAAAAEQDKLRLELSAVRSALAERDGELARLRDAPREVSPKPDLDEALAEHRKAWADAEASRLAAAEEEWRERAQAELSEVAARQRKAEAELAEALSRNEGGANPRDKVEILRLRDEVDGLKSTIAVRDVELAQAHATAEQLRRRVDSEHVDILPAHNRGRRRTDRAGYGENEAGAKRPIWRDIALVAAVVVCGILLYPYAVELVPYDWWPGNSYADEDSPAPVAHKPAPAPAADQPTDIVARAANVRSGPAKTESVVATLDRDVGVHTIEKKGNWNHVMFLTADGKKHDGWIFNTFLKPAPAKPAAGH